ncbi:DUF3152 domain-containing protein [Streptomyces sp. NBC_00059]|uniref:DUF3152 domain-containing protein n=1 Tax=Streptomyces sp. NBC_00059 TaxID=2975635 RepID=UPI002250A13A|nr:DUF3152 domain-containing protein [Streptomyces sp. NBC_00059]MCX5416467.1 DUF3152 domain-containing protein [Streptomyces sp. NBC_00059]
MGRHSRKGPEATGRDTGATGGAPAAGRGTGRRGRNPAPPAAAGTAGPFHDAPQVRGGHPEQREPGGGWGTGPAPAFDPRPRPAGPGGQEAHHARQAAIARQQAAQRLAEGRRTSGPQTGTTPLIPGPRREFVEAFDTTPSRPEPPFAPEDVSGTPGGPDEPLGPDDPDGPAGREAKGGKGRTFTGIAAAAVTTVLAVVVAGQVAQDSGSAPGAPKSTGVDRQDSQDASRSVDRPAPEVKQQQVKPLSYAQKMATAFPLAADLKGSGAFEAVPGLAKAPGKGQLHRYRIDVEKGLGLDAGLFAEAVQKTLNDNRSWAHNGAMTFERVSSGEADFVITLASPGTTAVWCEKSGLDTTEDNVSCDSAATDRVMINAYRWAQGAATFGPDKLLPYRQMLINHEVGHRLGHNHVSCRTPGALAPVMQQQTKTLDLDGIKCRPNPWVYPGS